MMPSAKDLLHGAVAWGGSVLLITLLTGREGLAPAAERIDYNAQIKPILSDRCYVCHGPDAENREAGLRLDLEEAAKAYAILPGAPGESELVRRISSEDPDERMPPAHSKLSLTKHEIDLITRWIEQGATWQEHWAFTRARTIDVPEVADQSWPSNAIDCFILNRLEQAGLRPSAPASREQLIRRLSFDLTGLPPRLDQIDRFVHDRSPDAYERLVDSLLRSPRYGERMTALWLDVARYSDTYGYQVDRDRFVWPWRDWVVRAFNANLPYDQFITEQLAGDLLPDATADQVLATAFNRLHPQKVEGGSVPEEFRMEYVADRTQTFATAFLGLTMECCRCHDHKYDPLAQREYYQLSAFFDNIDEAGLYSFFTQSVPTPTLMLIDAPTQAQLDELDHQLQLAEGELAATARRRAGAFDAWLARMRAASDAEPAIIGGPAPLPRERPPRRDAIIAGRVAHLEFEELAAEPNQSVPGRIGQAVELTGDDGIELKDVGNFHRQQPFSVALWIHAPRRMERAVIFHRSRAWTDAASRGYQLLIEDGCLSASLIHFWPGNAIRVKTRAPIPTQRWLHVAVTYDGSSRANGLQIYVDGRPADCQLVRDNLVKQITGGGGDHLVIGQRFRDRGFARGRVDDFQVFERQLTPLEVAQICDGRSLDQALAAPSLSDPQRKQLFEYFLMNVDDEYTARLEQLQQLRMQRNELLDGIEEMMVMRELPAARPTYLLSRGMYNARADRVEPSTPSIFPPLPATEPPNRLGLARWLVDPSHPLTARVAVNRWWQTMFGTGLVRTAEDFGRQGEPPSHPRLLDWLAQDFIDHGWNVKRLLKQIAMSATYRQQSVGSRRAVAQDPRNRLLARAPAYQLSAEMLRDNALSVSGLLVNRLGGAPAKPYDVEVSFKPVSRDQGQGLYRRSVYTYWKRTGPAPVMMTLDAAKRDVCQVRREQTSTPLQTFVVMNGPQFVEAARVLAQRLLQKYPGQADPLLVELFRRLTARRPTAQEQRIVRALFDQQQAYFQQQPERAEQFLAIGDAPLPASAGIDRQRLAAVASVANALFSFDEVVMKR